MSDHQIISAMRRFGGSFARALAEAWSMGDDDNRARIKATWPDLWEEYADLAKLHAERAAKQKVSA